jgi:hypothetical protein
VDYGQPIPVGPGYREMGLLIPFVVRNNGTDWHNYVVRMYLPPNTPVETVGGNVCCGYHKVPAFLNYQKTGAVSNHNVQTLDLLSTLFTDTISLQGPYVGAEQAGGAVPRLADLETIFQMPILGSPDSSGNFICTYWDWNFSHAEVAPAASAFQFVNPFTSGMQGWTTLGTLTNAANGAVKIRHLRWRLDFSQASLC